MNRRPAAPRLSAVVLWAISILFTTAAWASGPSPAPSPASGSTPVPEAAGSVQYGYGVPSVDDICDQSTMGSPYIPVDSWIYPAVYRLYSMGYIDKVFLGMRPWTRASIAHLLEDAEENISDSWDTPDVEQAQEIYNALYRELHYDVEIPCMNRRFHARLESAYTVIRGISGTPLRDSYHLGSTIVNDYGRPYQGGFNNFTGLSGYATAGRFTFYARGEFQGAPSAAGYSAAAASNMSYIDQIPFLNPATGLPYNQATIPFGAIGTVTNGRVLEAVASFHVLNHEISFGKHDQWLGPAQGASMAYSNNAENIYALQINRVEGLRIPVLSHLTGPMRYELLVGALQGHTYVPNPAYTGTTAQQNVINPGNPWVHVEKLSFRPTSNLEFGFERTVIWGGKGHEPITAHTFLKSFFSLANVSAAEKNGRDDPGARFGEFDFSYRLPFFRRWLTLYTDSEVHDDIIAPSAPRRGAWRPGLYLSHFPGVPRLDMRVEAAMTDPPHSRSTGGIFMYWETIQKQGYTNQGQLFGDWIGREDKGGQAWLTYHLSGNEWIQVNFRRQKAAKDFVRSQTDVSLNGTTLDDFGVQTVKRIGKDFEINGNFTVEHYKAPVYLPGQQTVTTTNIQLTWFPSRKVNF